MKPEPLKRKEWKSKLPFLNSEDKMTFEEWQSMIDIMYNALTDIDKKMVQGIFLRHDIRSAVEWLKKELFPFYKGAFSKVEIWRMTNDEICDKLEEFTNKKIDEAFEDVR